MSDTVENATTTALPDLPPVADDAPVKKKVMVLHEFHLIRDNGTERLFKPGIYDNISEADLNHWWVKANIGHAQAQPSKITSYEYEVKTPQEVAADRAMRFVQAAEAAAVAQEKAKHLEESNASRLERAKVYQEMMEDVRANGYDRYLALVKAQESSGDPAYMQAAEEIGAAEENGDTVTDDVGKPKRKTNRVTLAKADQE